MLLTTPGINNFISGVIFHEETALQKLDNGKTFPEFLDALGVVPGIKVDQGGKKFGDGDEEVTEGLDGLSDRLAKYSEIGLKFAKWRSLFKISDTYPSKEFLNENLDRLVSYAKICIESGVVPLLEPEVSMKGNHTTTRCAEITTQVLTLLFEKLALQKIDFGKIILKTNMVLPGQGNGIKAEPLEVAEATLRTFRKSVPNSVKGIVFLSGGQTPDEATVNLNEIIKRKGDVAWNLTFSYARALQSEALSSWRGKPENVSMAQEDFLARLKSVSSASKGEL